jgi:hypothetical protein
MQAAATISARGECRKRLRLDVCGCDPEARDFIGFTRRSLANVFMAKQRATGIHEISFRAEGFVPR